MSSYRASFIFQPCDQFIADIIAYLAAYILTPALRHGDAFGLIVNTLQHGIDIPGIEIVSGADGADRIDGQDGENVASFGCIDADGTGAVGEDKRVAERLHFLIDGIGVMESVEVFKILSGTADEIGQPHVLFYIRQHVRNIGDMGLAEIDVVIQPRAVFLRLAE